MRDTLEFWEILKAGKYDVYISDIVLDELYACPQPKRGDLLALLAQVRYNEVIVDGNVEIISLAGEIKSLKILPQKSENDRRHIAAAVISGCNAIVSWNFRHMVNVKTIDGVRIVCVMNNLPSVDIYSPTMLLERSY